MKYFKANKYLLFETGDEIALYSEISWADKNFDSKGRMTIKKQDYSSFKVGELFTSSDDNFSVFGQITKISGETVYFNCRVKRKIQECITLKSKK